MCKQVIADAAMEPVSTADANDRDPPGTKGGGVHGPLLPSIVDAATLEVLKDPQALKALDCIHPVAKKPVKSKGTKSVVSPDLQTIAAAVAATKLGVTEQLIAALDACEAVVNARDSEARTCLHYAAGYGHEDCVDALLTRSADPKSRDNNGDVPLHFAAIHGHPMCAYNIAKNSPGSCLVKNARGQTPVDVSVACERGEVLNAMLLACAGDSTAVAVKAMRKLLQEGAVPDTWAPNGSSALMLSASVNGTDALKVLIENGATIELQDALGRSALMFAAGNCAEDTLKLLLDHGACLAQRDRRGRTVLEYAPESSKVKALLEERLKQLELVASKAEQDLLASLEGEDRRSLTATKNTKRRKKVKGGTKAKLSAKSKDRKVELNTAECDSDDNEDGASDAAELDSDKGSAKTTGDLPATLVTEVKERGSAAPVSPDSWQVVGKQPRKPAAKPEPVNAKPDVAKHELVVAKKPNNTLAMAVMIAVSKEKNGAHHRRCGSAHSINNSLSLETEGVKVGKELGTGAEQHVIARPAVPAPPSSSQTPKQVATARKGFKTALMGSDAPSLVCEQSSVGATYATVAAGSTGYDLNVVGITYATGTQGPGAAASVSSTVDSATSLAEFQAKKGGHDDDMHPINSSASHCTDLSHCTLHTDLEFEALSAELNRMKSDNEKLRQAARVKELEHQQELAAVMEDAALHEVEAINKAVHHERLRLVSQLMSLGLAPELLVQLLSCTSIVEPLNTLLEPALSTRTPFTNASSNSNKFCASPSVDAWAVHTELSMTRNLLDRLSQADSFEAQGLDVQGLESGDVLDDRTLDDISASLGLDPLPIPSGRRGPESSPSNSSSFVENAGVHFSSFGLGLREEFLGGRCSFVAPARPSCSGKVSSFDALDALVDNLPDTL